MLILDQKVSMNEYIEKLTAANRLIVFRESTFQGKALKSFVDSPKASEKFSDTKQ